jgi:hypothetical protein
MVRGIMRTAAMTALGILLGPFLSWYFPYCFYPKIKHRVSMHGRLR